MEISQQVEWEQKRKDIYEGSLRHWLTTLTSSSDAGYEVKMNEQPIDGASLIAKTNLDGYYRMTLPGSTEVSYRGKSSQLSASGTLDNTREKVNVKLSIFDRAGDPADGTLSVTVTDANQVVPVATTVSIEKELVIEPSGEILNDRLLPIENGITVLGRLRTPNGKPVSGIVNIIQVHPKNFFLSESDSMGTFMVKGLHASSSVDLFNKSK